jgi:branched-chain amino acid transport system permease protein
VAALGFNIIVYLLLLNEDCATGGSYGLLNIPAPRIFGYYISERELYYLCLVSLAVVFLALERLLSSRFGRALKAISQDEDAARACGISVVLTRGSVFWSRRSPHAWRERRTRTTPAT